MLKPYIKLISILLAVFLLANIYLPHSPAFAEQPLPMTKAVQLGITSSYDLFKIRTDINKKKIELIQAREGLNDIREKERTIKFSLLFNLKLPEGHGMPKEIDLVTKIPTIQTEIQDLEKSYEDAKRKTESKIKLEYLNTIMSSVNIENNQRMLDQETEELKILKNRFKIGQATDESVKSKEEQVTTISKALKKSMEEYENQKEVLSDLVGLDVTYGYTFERKFITVNLERKDLKSIINYSRDKDMEVYKARSKYKMAESKVQLIRQIYRSAFGSAVSQIEAELNSSEELDYDAFLSKYENSLELIRQKWDGFFFIPLLFFVIPIPKSWLQPEFAGMRYFENEKYTLPVALIDRDKVKKEMTQAIKEHDKNTTNGYRNLKSIEEAYYNLVESYNKANDAYKVALRRNKMGLMSFEDLQGLKKDVTGKASSVVSNLAEYNKCIYQFSQQTGGAIDKYISKVSLNIDKLEPGISFVQKEDKSEEGGTPPEKGKTDGGSDSQESSGTSQDSTSDESSTAKWFIDSSNIDYKVYFRVSIPKSIGATHFALFTSDRMQIGTKVKIDERIPHMPILFKETGDLIVELYKDKDLVGTATLDGFNTEGELKIAKPATANDSSKSNISGTWMITPDESGLVSRFSITVDQQLGVTHYELYTADGKLIGARSEVSKPLPHLSAVLGSPQDMKLKLYKDDKLVANASLRNDGKLTIEVIKQVK